MTRQQLYTCGYRYTKKVDGEQMHAPTGRRDGRRIQAGFSWVPISFSQAKKMGVTSARAQQTLNTPSCALNTLHLPADNLTGTPHAPGHIKQSCTCCICHAVLEDRSVQQRSFGAST